jgi:serine/threonine protein kinase
LGASPEITPAATVPAPLIKNAGGVTQPSSPTGSEILSTNVDSSVIWDSGDAIQIFKTANPCRIATPDIPVVSSSEDQQHSSITEFIDPGDVNTFRPSLHDRLRGARLESLHSIGCYFIPLNKLDELITRQSIYQELELYEKLGKLIAVSKEDRHIAARKIWEIPALTNVTTRRKIFAVLVLMEKVEAILDFLEEEVYDSTLPFVFGKNQLATSKTTEEPIVIKLFQDKTKWKESEKDSFERYQWEMMAPYFPLSCGEQSSVRRLAVYDRAVLPFLEAHEESEGGFSIVRKVKIHPAHYNSHDFSVCLSLPFSMWLQAVDRTHQTTEGETTYFAVKTLKFQADATVLNNQEVQSLIRLNNENNPNLIRLLVTFQYRERLHLVFPWADGNLQNFWKTQYPKHDNPVRDGTMVRWLIEMCLGLALGLKAIHHNCVDKLQAEKQGLHPDASQKRHGFHGDLKPENILWFRQNSSTSPTAITGIFKVSDFGFADFHASGSASRIPTRDIPGMTPTYRAPEWTVKHSVAPSYDLWSFGCVLLEFIEWFLCGWQGVENFSKKRASTSVTGLPGYREDNFFNINSMGEIPQKATAKECVHLEFHTLRHHENSSDAILDLLNYIEDRLLRMEPKARDSCDNVVDRLQEIYQRCAEDKSYCSERRQVIREKRMTGLSELAASPAPSPATSPAPSPSFRGMEFNAIPSVHRHERSPSVASEAASSNRISVVSAVTGTNFSAQMKPGGGSVLLSNTSGLKPTYEGVKLEENKSVDAPSGSSPALLSGLGIAQPHDKQTDNCIRLSNANGTILSSEGVAQYLEVPLDMASERSSANIYDKIYEIASTESNGKVPEDHSTIQGKNIQAPKEPRQGIERQEDSNRVSTPQRRSRWKRRLSKRGKGVVCSILPCLNRKHN